MFGHQDFVREFLHEQRRLSAYLLGATGDSTPEDMLQTVARILWEKLADYDEARPFGAWATGVAQLEVLKWRQQAARSAKCSRKTRCGCWPRPPSATAKRSMSDITSSPIASRPWGLARGALEMKYGPGAAGSARSLKASKERPGDGDDPRPQPQNPARLCPDGKYPKRREAAVNDELQDLIDRYLDGSASAEETQRLDALLQQDPSARHGLLVSAAMEGDLRQLLSVATPRQSLARAVWQGGAVAAVLLLSLTGWATALYFGVQYRGKCAQQQTTLAKLAALEAQQQDAHRRQPAPQLAAGRVLETRGLVLLLPEGHDEPDGKGQVAQVAPGASIPLGRSLWTCPWGAAGMQLSDGLSMQLDRSTVVAFSQAGGIRQAAVKKGVFFVTNEDSHEHPFLVTTPQISTKVVTPRWPWLPTPNEPSWKWPAARCRSRALPTGTSSTSRPGIVQLSPRRASRRSWKAGSTGHCDAPSRQVEQAIRRSGTPVPDNLEIVRGVSDTGGLTYGFMTDLRTWFVCSPGWGKAKPKR